MFLIPLTVSQRRSFLFNNWFLSEDSLWMDRKVLRINIFHRYTNDLSRDVSERGSTRGCPAGSNYWPEHELP